MKFKTAIFYLLLPVFSFAQHSGAHYFIDRLKDNSNNQVLTRVAIHDSLTKMDTVSLVKLLNEMEQEVSGSSKIIKTRVDALKARLLFYQLGPGDSLYAAQMKDALHAAYGLDEPFMIAEYSRWYSEMINTLKRRNESVQYAFNSVVLQEQLGLQYFTTVNTFYFTIGELFLRTRNEEEGVKWLNKGLALPATDTVIPSVYANALNNLGLSYVGVKNYRKALEAYQRCMDYSMHHNLGDWYYAAYNNREPAFLELKQYDSCKIILDNLYARLQGTDNYYMHAGVCYWYGQLANRQKDFATALGWLKKAEEFADKTGVKAYRTRICREFSNSYDGLKQPDKALVYYKEYQHLHDSAQKAEASVKSEYLLAKANFEKEQLDVKKLKAKREQDIRLRNAGIISLLVISGVIIWRLNRKNKKAKKDREDADKQLKEFTANIINKDQQIEGLQNELQKQSDNTEKAFRVEELTQQMILTEDDWLRFQSLFNKSYPGYLHRLKEKFAGITEAEIRMACLIKIKLNTKQIASMQGISPDSVHKTRQRLRQRFDTTSTSELEAIISTI